MKLIVQGDDYGFTKAVTYGILEGIDHGVLTASGMFTNMEIAPWAASFIRERPDFCFGVDFNIVSGPSVSDPKSISHLVDENGQFIRSTVRTRDPRYASLEGRNEMFPLDEVYMEMKAQYDRFIELTGRKPCYLHAHSISPENYTDALHRISQETGIPFSHDMQDKYHFVSNFHMPKNGPQKKEFHPEDQLNKNSIQMIMDQKESLEKAEYAIIGGHPGYIDADLLRLSTLSLERCRDLEMVLSPVIRHWIEDNDIQLISYKDLK